METLTAFVRERTRWKEPDSAKPEAAANSDLWQSQPGSDEAQLRPRPATDIAAVLEVIRRRPDAGRKLEELREWRLDLNRTDLRGADLSEAHLEHVTLFRVHLEHADLFRTHLEHAKFRVAHLEHAILREAHLEHADVMALFDEHADLRGAHLEGADLRYTEGLTQPQIDSAEGDAATQLPEGRTRPRHWTELDAT